MCDVMYTTTSRPSLFDATTNNNKGVPSLLDKIQKEVIFNTTTQQSFLFKISCKQFIIKSSTLSIIQ